SMPETGLDGSHQFGSNYFPANGFHYGSDLVFNYGPLGYIINPQSIGNHIVVANLIRGGAWLLLLVYLLLLYRVGISGFWKSLLLMAAIIPSRLLMIGSFDYYVVAVLIVLIIYMLERPRAWLAPLSITILLGLLALMKVTGYVLGITCVGLYV